MKLRIISPVIGVKRPNADEFLARIRKYSGIDEKTELDSVRVDKGPASIESRYDEVYAIPSILSIIKESEGIDGFVVNCFADPGVKAGREISNIPIIGPGLSSMLIASAICSKFSIITIVNNIVPGLHDLVREYGFNEKLSSIRAIEVPVLELHKNEELTLEKLVVEGKKAIEQDGAEAIILGCTGFTGMADKLSEKLGVHVIDPLPSALKLVETLAKLRLSQSKITYPVPPKKTILF
jgi:allantoin racemase